MSKKLDIDKNPELWFPTFKAIVSHEPAKCPRCGSNKLTIIGEIVYDHMGYMFVTCDNCNKTGHLCRGEFPEGFKFDLEVDEGRNSGGPQTEFLDK